MTSLPSISIKPCSLPEFSDEFLCILFSTANCQAATSCCKSILVSSNGGAVSSAQGKTLGQYDMEGEINGKPYYTRERPGGVGNKYYFYMNSELFEVPVFV